MLSLLEPLPGTSGTPELDDALTAMLPPFSLHRIRDRRLTTIWAFAPSVLTESSMSGLPWAAGRGPFHRGPGLRRRAPPQPPILWRINAGTA